MRQRTPARAGFHSSLWMEFVTDRELRDIHGMRILGRPSSKRSGRLRDVSPVRKTRAIDLMRPFESVSGHGILFEIPQIGNITNHHESHGYPSLFNPILHQSSGYSDYSKAITAR